MKKKRVKFLWVVLMLLVVLLGIISFCYYKLVYSRNMFITILERGFDYAYNCVKDNDIDVVGASGSLSVNFSSSDEEYQAIFDVLNRITLSYNYGIDYKNSVADVKFNSFYDGKKLVNMGIYTTDGGFYFDLDNLYDRYVEIPVDEDISFNNKSSDYLIIISSLKHAVITSLKDSYFTKKKVVLDDRKVLKTTLDLSKDNYVEYFEGVVDSLVNDKGFLESCAKIGDLSVEELKEYILDIEISSDYDMLVNLYTDGFDFVEFEMINKDGTESIVIKALGDNVYDFITYDGNEEVGRANVKSTVKDDVVKIVSVVVYDELKMEYTINVNVDRNSKVEVKDVSDVVLYDELSDEDRTSIMNKLQEQEGFVNLVKDLSELFGWDDVDFDESLDDDLLMDA